MPAKAPASMDQATTWIKDMLGALAQPDSPGFSRSAISPTAKLVSAQRLDKDGQQASDDDVKRGKFNGRVVLRMKCEEGMANQLGSMHGGCVATIVDNLTSMAVYLHLPDLDPYTPFSFLGVSQSLSVVYLAAAPVDEWVEVDCSVVSMGARIVVLHADVWLVDGPEGERIKKTAAGTHTKVNNSLVASKL